MKYFIILLIGIGFIGTVLAVPEPFSSEEMYGMSENVVLGKILSVEILSEPKISKTENSFSEHAGIAVYEVQVEKYFKKQLDTDIIIVSGKFLREPHGMSYQTYPYQENQKVLLYLRDNEQGYGNTDLEIIDPQSRVIEGELCPSGTEYVEGTCQKIKTETAGSDAPFFGIFVYLDNLISWIFGR